MSRFREKKKDENVLIISQVGEGREVGGRRIVGRKNNVLKLSKKRKYPRSHRRIYIRRDSEDESNVPESCSDSLTTLGHFSREHCMIGGTKGEGRAVMET